MLVLLLFFCSGATALIYEVLWSRYLTLMLGSTVQAQTVVLAVFMGGLAIGNRLFGSQSAGIRRPLRSYAIIELVIGAYALVFPGMFRLADSTFVVIGSIVVDWSVVLLLLKLLLSVLLLLGPTVLMGGTLPLLAQWIEQQNSLEQSTRVGIFYAVNSLGAVVGAGLAGFLLIETFGLSSSLHLTAVANILIGAGALILSRSPTRATVVETPTEAPLALGLNSTRSGRWFGALVALTGAVSMGLEVLSARALVLMVGGSIQAFALVLMSFILGIGLGSVAISSSRIARRSGDTAICLLLLGAASLVIVHVSFIEEWALLYSRARVGLASNAEGYVLHQFAVGLLAFVFLGLPAAFLGAILPLAIRLVEAPGAALGATVGRLLTSNTLGAVGGVLVAGFVLMPIFGLRAALAVLAFVLIAAAGFIAFQRQQTSLVTLSTVFAAAALAGLASTGDKWRHVMSAGLFRVRNVAVTAKHLQERKDHLQLVFYEDSPDATVCVEKGRINNAFHLTLRINGKSDASTFGNLASQYLLAHLPMMARPNATNVFLLGFGSGITAGALLGHPIKQLTLAENCQPVLDAGSLFEEWNRGVLTNGRARIFNEDGRTVLKLRPDKYDVLVSGPSNPWVVGNGSVFSTDFYQLCASRLTDGGVMSQWFHKYEINDEMVFLVFRSFAAVFPYMEIWDTQEGDLVFLGSQKTWPADATHYQTVFERAQPARDLAELHITSPAALWARQVASQKTAAAIAGDGPLHSDDRPILEYAAPKAFFTSAHADRVYRFDERTIQFPLADRTKIEAMRALPAATLLESFRLFRASNPDLRLYLQTIASAPGLGASGILDAIYSGSADVTAKAADRRAATLEPMDHIIFRLPNSYPADPPIPPNARPELTECSKAEAGLLRDEGNWTLYTGQIEQALQRLISENNLQPPEFAPEYFAALVARVAIGHDDYRRAQEAIRLGVAFNSSDEQLAFLSRVVNRLAVPKP